VQNYLEKENINVVRNWPANSPDLNPIENCWSILKDKLLKKRPFPRTLSHMKTAIRSIWREEITTDICSDLVTSMSHRLMRVLELNGDRTGY